ncbi:hypothetical protein CROQUDRAFT_672829 [Cronartium quercuum f. sp. fusiforme G11]|uniref:Secreted protein n=1 Tax=Cronartium quercuum f. sp. fusiforme G11 TaxID=708437 RepID=A0A9P6NHH3_9BASI|nr:hypothetical protein CROQUDRAFT_672829 [Cronartium quercuum f. sp. fusiforme G11]
MITTILKKIIFITVFLTIAKTISAGGGVCCPGDKICSGCWMCEGSTLRNCWDVATAMPSKCEAKTDLQEKASCYCKAFAAIAKCWGAGTCCTEYAPTLAAATNLCNLATYPSDQMKSWELEHAISEGHRVATAIWNNNSGVDVPFCTASIQPYAGTTSTTPSGGSAPPPSSTQPKYTPPSKTKPEGAAHPVTTQVIHLNTSSKKDEQPTVQDYSKFEEDEIRKEKKLEREKEKSAYQKHQKHKNKHHSTTQSGKKACQTKHRNRKRATASYTTLDSSIGDARKLSKRNLCGIDYHGVAYPEQVPQTVQKAFDEL